MYLTKENPVRVSPSVLSSLFFKVRKGLNDLTMGYRPKNGGRKEKKVKSERKKEKDFFYAFKNPIEYK